MTFSFGRIGLAVAIAVLSASSCGAQSTGQAPAPTPASAPAGKVILSRSIDADGQTHEGAADAQLGSALAAAPTAQDAERQALTFTGYDLDVRLRAEAGQIAVRALVTVRNDGKTPLAHLPLQISSSLNWERIRLAGQDVPLQVATLNSDSDHTGQLHEAAVTLAHPLDPGASLQLDVTYSGAIRRSAQRLLAIGTPEDVARHSDWDRIGVDFTGLRGFGNVVWYPVSSVPVILGDGARLFDEIGEHKLRLTGADFRLRLTVEFPHGQAPTVALINGQPVTLHVTESGSLDQNQEVACVATATLDRATLGFEAPSLFLAMRTPHPGTNLTAWTLPEDNVSVETWAAAATAVTPFLQGWLGEHPRSQLTLLDLPDAQDLPFETGALLVTSLQSGTPEQLNGILIHALTHAWMRAPGQSSRDWLDEGVAHFMGSLWVEKQSGREAALGTLEAGRTALALAEPESPGQNTGQPLAEAISPVYYRTKAGYVFWMLRALSGDSALAEALSQYDPAKEGSAGVGAKALQKLLEQKGRDLSWFFNDWVNADKGLPDLSIDGVYPSAAQAGNYLVAVNISNSGYAAAEVPVTVHSGTNTTTERVLVPARGKVTQRLLVLGKPIDVQVNDGTVPETEASIHRVKLGDARDKGTGSSSTDSAPNDSGSSSPTQQQQ